MKQFWFVILAVTFLVQCKSKEEKTDWDEDTKTEILKQSDLKEDSIVLSYYEDSVWKHEYYYYDGQKIIEKVYRNSTLRAEIYYSKDANFELRREICDNGTVAFEGITYKGRFYGFSAWKNCQGNIREQGIRFNDQHIGIWKKWNDEGILIEEVDNKDISKLDSLPAINKL